MQAATVEAIKKAQQMFGVYHEQKQDTSGRFDVAAYLGHYGVAYKIKGNGGATIYQLDCCLFDSAHVRDAAVIQQADGQLGYKCFHDSCQGKGWREARQVISGTDNLNDFMPGKQAPRTDKTEDKPALTIVTMGEIHRMKKEFPKPLIEGLLEPGDSLLITGQGGLGKSLVTLSLALSVAAGKRLFDQFAIDEPHAVFLLQSENSLKATKQRLSALVRGHSGRADFPDYEAALDRIFTAMIKDDCRIAGNVLDPTFAGILTESLQATKADLLILDPLISYHRQQENDNTGMREALDELTRIVGPDTAIVVTHHHGKGEHTGAHQARGATAILDWSRGVITLNRQRHETKNLIKCTHTKAGNFEKAQTFLLEVEGASVVAVEPDIVCPPSKVVEILTDLGGMAESKNQFVKSITETCEVSRRTALEAINKAEDFGFVKVEHSGSAYVYRCVSQ